MYILIIGGTILILILIVFVSFKYVRKIKAKNDFIEINVEKVSSITNIQNESTKKEKVNNTPGNQFSLNLIKFTKIQEIKIQNTGSLSKLKIPSTNLISSNLELENSLSINPSKKSQKEYNSKSKILDLNDDFHHKIYSKNIMKDKQKINKKITIF